MSSCRPHPRCHSPSKRTAVRPAPYRRRRTPDRGHRSRDRGPRWRDRAGQTSRGAGWRHCHPAIQRPTGCRRERWRVRQPGSWRKARRSGSSCRRPGFPCRSRRRSWRSSDRRRARASPRPRSCRSRHPFSGRAARGRPHRSWPKGCRRDRKPSRRPGCPAWPAEPRPSCRPQ